jgi:hypothetical protein
MWVRKIQSELAIERKHRLHNFELITFVISCLFAILIYWLIGPIENILRLLKEEPEALFYLFLLPFMFYAGYRTYVIHGAFTHYSSTAKICLYCQKGMGYGDDGWRFKVFGSIPLKWWQIRACKTPEHCDIAYQCEVKLIKEKEL